MPDFTPGLRHLLAVAVPLAINLAAYFQPFVPPRFLMIDPLVAAVEIESCCKTYLGIVSTFGVILWFVTSAICLFAAIVLHAQRASRDIIAFAVFAGLLTGWLAVDDAFMVHENIAPKFGIPQKAVILAIVAMALVYIARCWRIILALDPIMFGLAGFGLAASVGLDLVQTSSSDLHSLFEDGAKFIGIVCWSAFHVAALAELCQLHAQTALDAQTALMRRVAQMAARSVRPERPVRQGLTDAA